MKTKSQVIDDNALIKKLVPKIEERIRADVIRSLISALEEQFYPPEEAFREDFVRRIAEQGRCVLRSITLDKRGWHLHKIGRLSDIGVSLSRRVIEGREK